jgi:hypothetical protein
LSKGFTGRIGGRAVHRALLAAAGPHPLTHRSPTEHLYTIEIWANRV